MTTLSTKRKVMASMGIPQTATWLRAFTCLVSRLVNAFRLAGCPCHARNVRRSRRVLRAIRSFTEPGMAGRCFSYLRQVDPLVFEEVVLSALEDAGALVLRNRRYTGDGGVDGVVWIATHGWIAVQVKRYSGYIDVQHVLEFGQVIRRGHFAGGLLMHTGRSGKCAHEAMHGSGITLLSGDRLLGLARERQFGCWRTGWSAQVK